MFAIAAGIVLAVMAIGVFLLVGEVLLTLWYRYTDPRR